MRLFPLRDHSMSVAMCHRCEPLARVAVVAGSTFHSEHAAGRFQTFLCWYHRTAVASLSYTCQAHAMHGSDKVHASDDPSFLNLIIVRTPVPVMMHND